MSSYDHDPMLDIDTRHRMIKAINMDWFLYLSVLVIAFCFAAFGLGWGLIAGGSFQIIYALIRWCQDAN